MKERTIRPSLDPLSESARRSRLHASQCDHFNRPVAFFLFFFFFFFPFSSCARDPKRKKKKNSSVGVGDFNDGGGGRDDPARLESSSEALGLAVARRGVTWLQLERARAPRPPLPSDLEHQNFIIASLSIATFWSGRFKGLPPPAPPPRPLHRRGPRFLQTAQWEAALDTRSWETPRLNPFFYSRVTLSDASFN